MLGTALDWSESIKNESVNYDLVVLSPRKSDQNREALQNKLNYGGLSNQNSTFGLWLESVFVVPHVWFTLTRFAANVQLCSVPIGGCYSVRVYLFITFMLLCKQPGGLSIVCQV